MKIRIISDIHLEFYDKKIYQLPKIADEENTILLLCGDICLSDKFTTFKYFFDDVSERFKHVVYIAGNHEYYGTKFPLVIKRLYEKFETYSNVFFLEKDYVIIDRVKIIGTTLWTDYDGRNPLSMYNAKMFMNDYKKIRTGPTGEEWRRKLRPEDVLFEHDKCLVFLKNEIAKQSEEWDKTIVMTHHAPTKLSIHHKFKTNELNGCYANSLFDLIYYNTNKIDYWFHGHTHMSCNYKIGESTIICNPEGYPTENYTGCEHNVIEI